MDVIEAIKTRRTIGRTKPGQEPERELIEKLLQSAIEAPNHYLTEPWRFFVLTGKAREAFGEAHAEGLRRRSADMESARLETLMNAERNKFLRAPALIVVGA
jgi:nitroreductase